MRKAMVTAGTAFLVGVAGPAWACGGLIAPNGAVGLVKTATLAAYADGVEHYVTQFEFAGAEGEFGSIVPLPGVPDRVVKGGEEKRIGALDITVLRGGGRAVGDWARENGFDLTPDAPEVLEFYARRSPVFMAAKFDATEAARRGLERGEGTSIHLAIPTDDPWVPLRILALGQTGDALVEADVFLLTERQPELLPGPVGSGAGWERDGLTLVRDEPASPFLLSDLAGDRGMGWLPTEGMWLSYLQLSEEADELRYDLAIDASGGQPSVVDAGLLGVPRDVGTSPVWVAVAVLGGLGLVVAAAVRRQARATA